jgi:hypothetical protein
MDRAAGAAVEANRLHDRERRGPGEDLDVAPPSTPVYFAMTGAAACSVTASRWALTAAHTFSP